MNRAVVATLLEVDPEFTPFLAELHGVSKMHDTSETNTSDPAKDKKVAQTGLAATGVATVGGLHALKATKTEAAHRITEAAEGAYKAPKLLGKLKPATAAKVVTAGWVGLHGAELVGDALGARAQTKAIQQANRQQKQGVSKAANPLDGVRRAAKAQRAHALGVQLYPAHPQNTAAHFDRHNDAIRSAVRTARSAGHSVRDVGAAQRAGVAEAEDWHDSLSRAVGAKGARKVSKAAGHFQPIGNVQANARARALGLRNPGATAGHAVGPRKGLLTAVAAPIRKGLLVPTEMPETEWVGDISKVAVEKRQVFGWASLSMVDGEPVYDRQGDYIDILEAEDAAYKYMLASRKGGDMHRRIAKFDAGPVHTADVIESMVFTPEKLEALGLESDALPLGWWLGMQIHDEQQWQDVKSGKRTGFSVHGSGTRKALELV